MARQELKSGHLVLHDFLAPDTVQPGESMEVEVTVSNGALAVSPFDDAYCGGAEVGYGDGYHVEVVLVLPDGGRRTKETCVKTTEIGSGDDTVTFSVTSPDAEGDHHYEVLMRAGDAESGALTEWVTVDSGATTVPDDSEDPDDNDSGDPGGWRGWTPGGDEDDQQGGNWLGNLFGGGGGPIAQASGLLVLLAVVYVVVSAGGDG